MVVGANAARAWSTGSMPVPMLVAMAAMTTEQCGERYAELRAPLAKAHAEWRQANSTIVLPIEAEQGYRAALDKMSADVRKRNEIPEQAMCELLLSAFYNNAWPLSENTPNTALGVLGMQVAISSPDDLPYVEKTIDGFDAKAKGIQPGDRITAINQVSTKGLQLIEVTGRLRGPAGSQASITVKRSGSETPITYQVTRRAWQ
jgi:C-terminal processing protease CtpA/Prc